MEHLRALFRAFGFRGCACLGSRPWLQGLYFYCTPAIDPEEHSRFTRPKPYSFEHAKNQLAGTLNRSLSIEDLVHRGLKEGHCTPVAFCLGGVREKGDPQGIIAMVMQ